MLPCTCTCTYYTYMRNCIQYTQVAALMCIYCTCTCTVVDCTGFMCVYMYYVPKLLTTHSQSNTLKSGSRGSQGNPVGSKDNQFNK